MAELYISIDVETDGPIPGPHSMLSLGAAAFDAERKLHSTFTCNLEPLEGAAPHPETAAWWETQSKHVYDACRTNPLPTMRAMRAFDDWLKQLGFQGWDLVCVGAPAGFDFTFVYWYLMKFVGRSRLGLSAIDLRTYAMATLKVPYQKTSKSKLPTRWFGKQAHTHIALDDAIEQGELFINMLKENVR